MFDIGGVELLIIAIVALIVVGPKDLPKLFLNVGRFVGRAKGMAREFTSAMNDAARDSGISDIQKTLNTASNPIGSAMDSVKKEVQGAASAMTDIDPKSETGKLSAERAEASRKIQAKTARAAAERKQREAEEALRKAEELEAAAAPETKDT